LFCQRIAQPGKAVVYACVWRSIMTEPMSQPIFFSEQQHGTRTYQEGGQ
jgi:hypothetical protein